MAARQLLQSTSRALSLSRPITRQVTTSASAWRSELSSVLDEDTQVSQKGSGWGQTKLVDVLEAKGDHGNWLWCSRDDSVFDAIKKMTKANAGSLLVFDASKLGIGDDSSSGLPKGDAVEGIVTERDYLTKVAVRNKSSKDMKVAEIMTAASKLMTVDPQQTTMDAMALMIKNNFRHVPVVSGGTYMGMVSMRDVVKCLIQEHHDDMGRMHEYIQGSY